jgi:serine/threonine protein kinase
MTPDSRLAFGVLEGGVPRREPGARLGRYELLARVGAGGMAEVWIAQLRGTAGFSKLVAIKMMLPHLASLDEARHMLFDEARVAARINHPNVVGIQELSEEQGMPFMVMDWIDGLPLSTLLHRGGPIAAAHAARIIADAALGLHAAHELVDDAGQSLHVVHRDISPFNLLLGRTGTVQVADFGIVKSKGQLHRTTTLGGVRGRVPYMAPEQVTGQAVDRRADIFALGATLHEILTGELAFPGDNDAQIIYQITERGYRAPRLEEEPEDCPAGLFEIVARALQRSPVDRFATAEEMRLALEGWLAEHAPPIITSSSIAELVRERGHSEFVRRDACLRAALTTQGTQPHLQLSLQGMAELNPTALDVRGPKRFGAWLVAPAIVLVLGGWGTFARRSRSAGPGVTVAREPSLVLAPSATDALTGPSGATDALTRPSAVEATSAPNLQGVAIASTAAQPATSALPNAKNAASRHVMPVARTGSKSPTPAAGTGKKPLAPALPEDELPANPY